MGDEIEVKFDVHKFNECFVKTNSEFGFKKIIINAEILSKPVFVFRDEGHFYPMDVRSDLKIVFNVLKPSNFDYKGFDLFLRQEISLKDALLRSSVKIVNIDQKLENLLINQIVQPFSVFKIEKKGFIRTDRFIANRNSPIVRGDLYVTFEIKFPDFLSFEQKKVVREILTKS